MEGAEVIEKEATDEVVKEVASEETQQDQKDSPEIESPDDLLDFVHGIGKYAKEAGSDKEQVAGEEVSQGGEEDESAPIQDEKRAEELLAKSEKEGLTDEEAAELVKMGYEEESGGENVELGIENEEDDGEEKQDTEGKWEAPSYVDPLKELYPDGDFSSENGVTDAIYSLIADSKANQDANTQLETALQEDPEFASFMEAVVVNKKSVAEAALEAGIDLGDAIPEPGDDGYKEYILAQEKKKENAKKANQFKQTRDNNLKRSESEVKRYFAENRVPEKEMKVIGEQLDKVFSDIYNGKVTVDFIKMVHEGITAPEKIKTAAAVAEIKGRNEVIKKKWKRKKGDGQPKLGGKKTSIQSQPKVTYADDGIEDVMRMLGEA